MRKNFDKKILLIILLPIFLSINTTVSGFISIEHNEITIDINKNLKQENTTKIITIENTENHVLNVTWYLECPHPSKIRENKTTIPNLSWIDVKPRYKILNPKEKTNFNIYTDIPNDEQYYDKNWELWITFKQGDQEKSEGFIKIEHAVRVYVNTPVFLNHDDLSLDADKDNGLHGVTIDDRGRIDINIIGFFMAITAGILIIFFYKKTKK